MEHSAWLNDVIVFLVSAGVVVPFFHRFRIGAVLGFLIIGVVVGPFGLGRFADPTNYVHLFTIEHSESVVPLAEWGVIFLLFLLGLESSAGKLWELRRYVFGVGALQVAGSALVIGVAVSLIARTTPSAAVILGLCLALSSTAIVMQILVEDNRVATLTGRVALSVLLFQDLMVVPILFVANFLGRGNTNFNPAEIGLAALEAFAAVAAILIVGRFLLRPLLRLAARTGSRDLIMAISMLIVVGAAGTTGAAGLSSALGAFLAGLLLSESEYRHQIDVDLEPFKGLLLGLFFMTVGMSLDPVAVVANWQTVLLGLVALLVIKAAVFYLAGRTFGVRRSVTVELALLLAQGGEFALVVIGIARVTGILTGDLATVGLAVAALSMMATPVLAVAARRAARALAQKEEAHHELHVGGAGEFADHVVIGGYGRVGRMIGRLLASENVPFIALDTNGELVTEGRKQGAPVYFGDASRHEILERAGINEARAFVVTLNAPRQAERMARAILNARPDACVLARARDAGHAARLAKIGVTYAVPETIEASLQLGGQLLVALGVPDDAADRRVDWAREEELARIAAEGDALPTNGNGQQKGPREGGPS